MTLGDRVRELRLARGMVLAQVAGNELSVALVSKIERGLVSPSLATLAVLAGRLGVTPGALLDGGSGGDAASGLVAAARAYLLLGDPARANEVAEGGAGKADGVRRVALLAVQAEALLAVGNGAAAAERVLAASRLLSAGSQVPLGEETEDARAALAWALGLLERRRGDRAGAQRSWTACLDALEGSPERPWAWLLRARVRVELAGLHELAGAAETARAFLLESIDDLRRLVDAAGLARHVLEAEAAGDGGLCGQDALALAVCASARRLLDQAEHALTRLDRSAMAWPAAAAPAEVSHSRHLR